MATEQIVTIMSSRFVAQCAINGNGQVFAAENQLLWCLGMKRRELAAIAAKQGWRLFCYYARRTGRVGNNLFFSKAPENVLDFLCEDEKYLAEGT